MKAEWFVKKEHLDEKIKRAVYYLLCSHLESAVEWAKKVTGIETWREYFCDGDEPISGSVILGSVSLGEGSRVRLGVFWEPKICCYAAEEVEERQEKVSVVVFFEFYSEKKVVVLRQKILEIHEWWKGFPERFLEKFVEGGCASVLE